MDSQKGQLQMNILKTTKFWLKILEQKYLRGILKLVFLLTSTLVLNGCIHAVIFGGMGQIATYTKISNLENRLYKLETRFEPDGVKVKEKKKRFPRYRKRSSSSYVPSYVNMETFTNGLYK